MINVNTQRGWGRLSFHALPYFRSGHFPGEKGRFRSPVPIDNNDEKYQSSAEEYHLDFAIRYSHYIGNLDLGVYLYEGTNREALLSPSADSQSLTPYYEKMTQIGIDLQYTWDAWLWKMETIYRNSDNDNFWAVVAGLEYTIYQVTDTNADVGLLVEYLRDERNPALSVTPSTNDLFFGTRLAPNNSQDTSLLAGIAIDLDNQSTFFNLEAEHRLGKNISLEARMRIFSHVDQNDGFYSIRNDDYGQLRLSWFF